MRPVNWLKLTAACVLCALLMLCAALSEARVTLETELGYEGAVTYLNAMPLRVRLRNDGDAAELTVAVNLTRTPQEYDRYEYPVTLAGGAEMALTLPLNITYKQPAYTVEVLEDGAVIASKEIKPQKTLAPDTLLVGLLTDAPQGMRYLNINASNDDLMRGETWQTLALTADTFPDSPELMRAFRILAVDAFDVTTLSAGQQSVLRQWIREGGIVIVGGGAAAAVSGKAFSTLTGVLPGMPYQAQDVQNALIDALADGAFALTAKRENGSSALLAELKGGHLAVAQLNGKTLIDRTAVGNGVVYTCAFSMSERPLSGWGGMNGFWQRVLLSADQSRYQRIINQLQNYYDSGDHQYVDSSLLRQLTLDNPDRVALVAALIAGFIILSGIGSYLILKKLDKREWMWVTVPVLSLISAVLTLGISGNMQINKPAAATYAVVKVDTEAQTDTSIMTGVAAASPQALRVAADGAVGLRPNGSDYNYYMDEDEQTENVQPRLRYTYTYGDEPTVTMPRSAAWDVQMITMRPETPVECPVTASIWWEEDGLHGEILNASQITLAPGYVITSQGYCNVPELLPGAQHSFAILENPDRKPDPDTTRVYPGELVSDGYVGVYTVMEAAVWPDGNGYSRDETDSELLCRRSLLDACRNDWPEYNAFHYVTFTDQIALPALTLNGTEVTRSAATAVIDVNFNYQAIGKSGLVRLSRGMVPIYHAEVTADKTPVSTGMTVQNYVDFALRDEPVLCFALGEIGVLDLNDIEIGSAKFICEAYGVTPWLWLYNAAAGQWEELNASAFPAAISGEQLRRCLSPSGQLFLRLGNGGGRSNGEVYNPALTLEGRVK